MRSLFALVCLLLIAPAGALAQTRQPVDPAAMSPRQLREELTNLRGLVQGRAVLPARPPGCTSTESRQFDFWLGEWDVSPTGVSSGATVAESSITLTDQGCVIIEEWRPFGDGHGHSINMYDTSDQKWHQTWADASGRRTEYAGTLDSSGVLRLDNLGPPLPGQTPGRRRMNFQRIDENTVRQWSEVYDDAAGSWTVAWDFTYRRRPSLR